jgi:hypothetical protein
MIILPEHNRQITQTKQHRYKVEGLPCRTCANCVKGWACIGLPSVTTISGRYTDADMYGAGYRAALNTVFGEYTNRDKDAVAGNGWIAKILSGGGADDRPTTAEYRQEVEAIPTPGEISRVAGVNIHENVDDWLNAKLSDTDPYLTHDEYTEPARRIVEWLDMHECEILETEVMVYHPTMLYGGQIDCVAKRGDSLLIFDWKSGKGVYNNAAAQIGGYAMAYEAMTGERVDEGWVLQSTPDNVFAAYQIPDLYLAQALFCNFQTSKELWDQIKWKKM